MTTTNLRQRVPFKSLDDDDAHGILDDQEQENLMETLRSQNASSSKQQLFALSGALALSCLLQLIYLFSSSKASPLFAIAPSPSVTEPPVPLPNLFSCLSITVHVNLALLLYPRILRDRSEPFNIKSLSYTVTLSLSAVAPILCILLGRSWQTVVWWSFTILVVLIVYTVQASIAKGDESVRELEKLKYAAPGA